MRLDEKERNDIHDEDDADTLVNTETNGSLTRYTYENTDIAWKRTNRFLIDYEQDLYEEAYQMGWRARDTDV